MTDRRTYLADSSALLRFFTDDVPAKAKAVRRLVERAGSGELSIEVPFVTVSETMYTLCGLYRLKEADVARELIKFLKADGIRCNGPEWILDALHECETGQASFGDACIAVEARVTGKEVLSYDTDFDGIAGVVRFEPK